MELFVDPHQNYTFLLEIIIKYLKLDQRNKVKVINLSPFAIKAINQGNLSLTLPSLVTHNGKIQTQIFQICKILLQILPQLKMFFLGEGQQANEIASIKSQLKQGKQLRKHLNKLLQSKTFFVGNHITFADFYMFTQLYDNMIDLTDEQKSQYNNLFRWYKHIQNLPQITYYLKASNRFIVKDQQPKIPFLADKKKSKEKKQKKKIQEKKEQTVVFTQAETVKEETKIQLELQHQKNSTS